MQFRSDDQSQKLWIDSELHLVLLISAVDGFYHTLSEGWSQEQAISSLATIRLLR
jgi:hypothetical protein